jgi:hypothetical protein
MNERRQKYTLIWVIAEVLPREDLSACACVHLICLEYLGYNPD